MRFACSFVRVMVQGLRYDDLYDPYHHLDIKEALARRPREVCLVPSPRIASSRPTASSARSSRRRGARPEGTRGSRPLFPGFYMPIYVKILRKALMISKGKKELLRRLHEVGTLAQITSIHGDQVVLLGHRRLRITEMVQEDPLTVKVDHLKLQILAASREYKYMNFGQGDEEEEEVEQEEMATHNQNAAAAAAPAPQLQNRGGVAALGKQKAVEISSGSDVSQKQSEGSASSVRKCSRKKVINTLTSVLTARSKVACGITDKPREVIEDIDKLDGDNQLAVVDYVEDVYKFYKIAENECHPCDYIDSQVEIISKMRAILADWIIEVHHKFELMLETLYLTMYIIDRYLSMQPMLRRELHLVGVSAMLIACKYEEIQC